MHTNDWSSDFIPHGLLRARQEPLEAASEDFRRVYWVT